MTQYVYMNERIKQKKPSKPVIVAQDDIYGSPRVREANEFELWYHGDKIGRIVFNPAGLPQCESHSVKAWVELDDLIQVVCHGYPKPAKPKASAKKPGKPVVLS